MDPLHGTTRGAICARLAETGADHCAICGAPPHVAVVWVTTPAVALHFGCLPGQLARLAYTLCARCSRPRRMPATLAAVEDRILATVAARRDRN